MSNNIQPPTSFFRKLTLKLKSNPPSSTNSNNNNNNTNNRSTNNKNQEPLFPPPAYNDVPILNTSNNNNNNTIVGGGDGKSAYIPQVNDVIPSTSNNTSGGRRTLVGTTTTTSTAGGSGNAATNPSLIFDILKAAVEDQNIQAFYSNSQLKSLANTIANSKVIEIIIKDWKLSLELGMSLCKLALFDTVLYLDDSGSMAFEEGGSRIEELKLIISKVAFAASLFDQDGIQVRFMNSKIEGNNITSESEALKLISKVKFSGLTPLGTSLDFKVLQPLLIHPAKRGNLQKPLLIIVVTDGIPGGEPHDQIVKVIKSANKTLMKTKYGADAVSYQLAQVGNDLKARAFLEELDNNREIGELIDTTSNYENEADDMSKANPPIDLTPELWMVKLLMGGIDSSYDSLDE